MINALAIVPCYNEIDILPYTVRHLNSQGIYCIVLDNWSTDGSYEWAAKHSSVERFPEAPSKYYEWENILRKVEDIAFNYGADWSMLNDADEIRYSNIEGETLLEAFERVGKQRYNAVDFTTKHYRLTSDTYSGNPEKTFKLFTIDTVKQIKTWKNTGQKVDLHSSGGHDIQFEGRDVYPDKFILNHYPFRSLEQANRKIFKERIGRYSPDDLAKGFHCHYDKLAKELSNA